MKRYARRTKGLTLLEVSIAVGVLATALMGVFSVFISSERIEIIAREESIALYAAEEAINEIRNAPFTTSQPTVIKVVSDFNKETRAVNLDGPNATKQRLSMGDVSAPYGTAAGDGIKVPNELGIIMIDSELPVESNYGDVDGDGDLDFPLDLNQNGRFTDTVANAFPFDLGGTTGVDTILSVPLMKIVPVAVIVRWNSLAGIERRIQIVTFITDRLGAL